MIENICLVVEERNMSNKNVNDDYSDEDTSVEHDDLVPEHSLLPSDKCLKFCCFSTIIFVSIVTIIVFGRFCHIYLSVTYWEEKANG